MSLLRFSTVKKVVTGALALSAFSGCGSVMAERAMDRIEKHAHCVDNSTTNTSLLLRELDRMTGVNRDNYLPNAKPIFDGVRADITLMENGFYSVRVIWENRTLDLSPVRACLPAELAPQVVFPSLSTERPPKTGNPK